VSFSGMPPWQHAEPREPGSARLRRSLKQLALATVVIGGAALALGWLFARSDAPSAARLLLDDDVATEELQRAEPGPDPRRPTSGPQRGSPSCGVLTRVPEPGEQVVSLAAGVVILHHREDVGDATMEVLRGLVDVHDRVLVVPGRGQDAEVVATAWRHRYEQTTLDATDLERFVVGWGGRGPRPRPCP
jgi:hypothetical protein